MPECRFARERTMSAAATSAWLNIVMMQVRDDADDFARTASQSAAQIRDALTAVTVERPPHSSNILSHEDALAAHEWILVSYLRSFHLYKHALAARPELHLRQSSAGGTALPRVPPPLAEAMPVGTE
jgi:hypothetical protein